MVRFITLTLFFAFISLVSAQLAVINTPSGNLNVGANVTVTWSTNGSASQPGTLLVINRDTQNTTTISTNIDLNSKIFYWIVNVSPGNYFFTLNDGSGAKFSGVFVVVEPSAGTAPSGPPSGPPGRGGPGGPDNGGGPGGDNGGRPGNGGPDNGGGPGGDNGGGPGGPDNGGGPGGPDNGGGPGGPDNGGGPGGPDNGGGPGGPDNGGRPGGPDNGGRPGNGGPDNDNGAGPKGKGKGKGKGSDPPVARGLMEGPLKIKKSGRRRSFH